MTRRADERLERRRRGQGRHHLAAQLVGVREAMPAAASRAQQAAVEARAVLLFPGNGGEASGGSSGQWAASRKQ